VAPPRSILNCTSISASGICAYTTWSDGSIKALKIMDGTVRWDSASHGAGITDAVHIGTAGEQPIVVASWGTGGVSALLSADGSEKWRNRDFRAIASSSTNLHIFVLCADGSVKRLDPGTGGVVWSTFVKGAQQKTASAEPAATSLSPLTITNAGSTAPINSNPNKCTCGRAKCVCAASKSQWRCNKCNSYNKAAMTRCKCELIGQNTRPEVQIKADSIQQAAASASAPQQMEQVAFDARRFAGELRAMNIPKWSQKMEELAGQMEAQMRLLQYEHQKANVHGAQGATAAKQGNVNEVFLLHAHHQAMKTMRFALIACRDKTVRALHSQDGSEQWCFKGECMPSSLSGGAGQFFVTWDDGSLSALNLQDGSLQWHSLGYSPNMPMGFPDANPAPPSKAIAVHKPANADVLLSTYSDARIVALQAATGDAKSTLAFGSMQRLGAISGDQKRSYVIIDGMAAAITARNETSDMPVKLWCFDGNDLVTEGWNDREDADDFEDFDEDGEPGSPKGKKNASCQCIVS